jgi:hypothetical protein
MVLSLPTISYEEINLASICQLVGADARVILEIGAHHGWDTAALFNTFANATIYAFEPDPRAIEKFSTKRGGAANFRKQSALSKLS